MRTRVVHWTFKDGVLMIKSIGFQNLATLSTDKNTSVPNLEIRNKNVTYHNLYNQVSGKFLSSSLSHL